MCDERLVFRPRIFPVASFIDQIQTPVEKFHAQPVVQDGRLERTASGRYREPSLFAPIGRRP